EGGGCTAQPSLAGGRVVAAARGIPQQLRPQRLAAATMAPPLPAWL
ncbi:hypothetical protein TSOC_015270, partial [Tetrabaena socialis]